METTVLQEPSRQDAAAPPPQLKRWAPDELIAVLTAHRAWLRSDGSDGQAADLRYADLRGVNLRGLDLTGATLSGADLTGADLRGAILRKSDLTGANLSKADLNGANLERADLRGADLSEARVRRADLTRADLREADLACANFHAAELPRADLRDTQLRRANFRDAVLQEADLTSSRGLLVGQLGGANLAGARLPDDIATFEGLANVAEASKMTQNLFTTILLACAYAWLTIASTTDAQLLNNAAPPSSRLPILGTDIPLVRFYAVAPLLLLCLYVYFHLGLQRLWEELSELPAVFPDGRPLDKKAYPWLLNVLVRAHAARLKENRSHLSRWQARISVVLAWGLVPISILAIWGRYLRGHDRFVTALHVLLLSAAIGASVAFLRLAASTLQGSEKRPSLWKKAWKGARADLAVVFLGQIVLFSLLSFGAIEGADPNLIEREITRRPDYALKSFDPRHWVPHAFALIGYRPFAHLDDVHLSTPPTSWTLHKPERQEGEKQANHIALNDHDFDEVKAADLEYRNLRFASAYNAFLVTAYMQHSDLCNSDFRDADLRKADLRSTNLSGANFRDADLRGAELRGAHGVEVKFRDAELGEADLKYTDLPGARLKGASLWKANLTGANLAGANFEDADLSEATLTREPEAKAPPMRLFRANFTKSNLSRANLTNADLRKSNLTRANLTATTLCGADLRGADLSEAVGLDETQLSMAIIDKETKVPKRLERFKAIALFARKRLW